jgi:hypothetical protein
MQELRDMPIPDAAAQEQEQVAIPDINPLDMQTASPVVNPLPPPIRKARTLRHSFSSSTIPSTATRSTLRVDEDVEATVELHEESAAAFQDFLFWAYPHLDCRVSWTNVEAVSTFPLVFVKGLMGSWSLYRRNYLYRPYRISVTISYSRMRLGNRLLL